MNYHSDKWIADKIQKQFSIARDYCEPRGHEVVGVFLHGSQNYGLDTESSDVDSVCIYMPSKQDIVFNKQDKGHEIKTEFGIIVCWEIRKFFQLLRKGGFNQLEILYTPHRVVSPKYFELWATLDGIKDRVSLLNQETTLNSFYGMLHRVEREIKLELLYSQNKININKNLARFFYFLQCLELYAQGTEFSKVLYPENSDLIKSFRNLEGSLLAADFEFLSKFMWDAKTLCAAIAFDIDIENIEQTLNSLYDIQELFLETIYLN